MDRAKSRQAAEPTNGTMDSLPQTSAAGHLQQNPGEKRGLPRLTKSDNSFDRSQTSLSNEANLVRCSSSAQFTGGCTNPLKSEDSDASQLATDSRSNCTIGSGRLTESDSQSSGYTTESSYQTATAGSYFSLSSTSYFSQEHNLREIHVGVDAGATDAQIQAIRSDLRNLLCNEVALISEASGGSRRAIYLIAYQHM